MTDLDANAGGVAWLMEHHRGARAFLHCSTTAVYRPSGHRVFVEEDQLGDNHGVWPFLRTYSICKIAAEGAARWGARRFGLATTIARLSVPYGDSGGWPGVHLEMLVNGSAIPVHIDAPSTYNPIHHDDVAASVPGLLAGAGVPATVVNWGGDEAVSIEEWCTYLAGLTGLDATFAPTDRTIDSVEIDTSRRRPRQAKPKWFRLRNQLLDRGFIRRAAGRGGNRELLQKLLQATFTAAQLPPPPTLREVGRPSDVITALEAAGIARDLQPMDYDALPLPQFMDMLAVKGILPKDYDPAALEVYRPGPLLDVMCDVPRSRYNWNEPAVYFEDHGELIRSLCRRESTATARHSRHRSRMRGMGRISRTLEL